VQILFLCENFTNHVPMIDAVYQISEYLECQFMRRRFFKISPNFNTFCGPKSASSLIFANLNPNSLQMVPTKFGWNQFKGNVYRREGGGYI